MRLDRLAPHLRDTIRAASVLGQVFWTGAISALVEREAAQDLTELQAAEIVTKHIASRVSGEEEWSFRQTLVRDTAYASIVEEDRASLHQVAGSWLESVGDADVGLLAKHADAGHDFQRAAELYARATRQPYANGAHLETALELAERGLQCGAEGGVKAGLLLAAAQARIPLGRLEDGIRAAEQAAELAPRGSDMWAEAERLVAKALIEHGRAREGDARVARALSYEFEEPLSESMRASLLAVRVRGLVDLSMPREARQVAEEATALARRLNSAKGLLEALDARLFALMQLGDPAEVVASGPQVIDMADSVGDVVLAVKARVNTASSMNLFGLWEDARALLERALADARDRRMRILEAFALHNLGMCEARLGHFDRGIRMQRDAYKIADETHAARLRFHARVYEILFVLWKASAARARGADITDDLARARSLLATIEELASSLPSLAATASFVAAEVHLAVFAAGEKHAAEQAIIAALNAHNTTPHEPRRRVGRSDVPFARRGIPRARRRHEREPRARQRVPFGRGEIAPHHATRTPIALPDAHPRGRAHPRARAPSDSQSASANPGDFAPPNATTAERKHGRDTPACRSRRRADRAAHRRGAVDPLAHGAARLRTFVGRRRSA